MTLKFIRTVKSAFSDTLLRTLLCGSGKKMLSGKVQMCSTSWVSFELYFSQQQCLKITRSTDPKNSKYIFPLTEYVSHRLFLLLFISVSDEVYMLTSFS